MSSIKQRIVGMIISLISGFTVIAVHYFIPVPEGIVYARELTIGIFTIVSIFLLFPVRNFLIRRILKRSQRQAFMGGDFHHLNFLARPFTMESMIHEIVPEFLQWLNVGSAKMGILEPTRKSYQFIIYNRGAVLKDHATYYQSIDELARLIKSRSTTIYGNDPSLPEEDRKLMEKFRAAALVPFIYRKHLTGFLILHEVPENKYMHRALDLFASKASVMIQNSILTSKIINSEAYEKELKAADKIRNLLQNTRLSKVSGFQIERTLSIRRASLIEVVNSDNRSYLVILSARKLTGGAGLILAGMLGSIYSMSRRDSSITLHKLISTLRKSAPISEDYRIDIFIAEFLEESFDATVMVDGSGYRVFEDSTKDLNLNGANKSEIMLTHGWRNFIKFTPERRYTIQYRQESLVILKTKARSLLPAGLFFPEAEGSG